MGNKETDVCILVREKEHLLSKDTNKDVVQWRAKKKIPIYLIKINSDTNILWSVATGVWVMVCKNKLHQCRSSCCSYSFLQSPCLVSSHNALSPLLHDQTKLQPVCRLRQLYLLLFHQR